MNPISDILLERFRLGEVSPDERAFVEAALARDASVQARLDALEADSAATLARHPPAHVARLVRRRAEEASRQESPATPLMPAWLAPALAVAAALLVGLWWSSGRLNPEDDVRLKGGPQGPTLSLFRLGPAGPEPLSAGARVRPGQVVQARFTLEAPAAVLLLSYDSRGAVTVHLPPGGLESAVLPAGRHATPRSFELDATPGFERFVLVTSSRSFAAGPVLEAARALATRPGAGEAALPLPDSFRQHAVTLAKDTP